MRRINELVPIRIFKTRAGDEVVDLGRGTVGRARLKVKGPAGNVAPCRGPNKRRQLLYDNLRSARSTVRYTLSGKGTEVFEPHFTYQGFRYVAVSGYPGKLARAASPASRAALDGCDRNLRIIQTADQSAAAQYSMGAEGKIPSDAP